MPRFEDSFRVNAPRPRVWALLDDPARVAACVPGCEEVTAEGADRFRARLRVKVGPIATTQQLTLTVTERTAPGALPATGRGGDRGPASPGRLRAPAGPPEAPQAAATDAPVAAG